MRPYKQRNIQSISSGYFARDESETDYAVAVGRKAGYEGQGTFATAIGDLAGENSQGTNAVALGSKAGQNSQGTYAIAIGDRAGFTSQGTNAIAIGIKAGHGSQGTNAIAIGTTAGQTSQGTNAIAIDTSAGTPNQPANSIIINTSPDVIVDPKTSGLYVAPVRETAFDSNILVYGADKEISRGFPRLPTYTGDTQATAALTLAVPTETDKNGYLYLDSTLMAIKVYVNNQWLKLSTDLEIKSYLEGGTGELAQVKLDNRAVLDTATLTTTTTTADQVVDSFSATTYRSAKYLVQIESKIEDDGFDLLDYQSVECLIIHNGTTASITTYADIKTGSTNLATFGTDISSGSVRLLTTPTNAATTYKVVRTVITAQ